MASSTSPAEARRTPLGVKDAVSLAYKHPALIPGMEQLPGRAPEAPDNLKAKRVSGGIELTWHAEEKQRGNDQPGTQAYYVVYRAPAGQAIDFDDARFIVTRARRTASKK